MPPLPKAVAAPDRIRRIIRKSVRWHTWAKTPYRGRPEDYDLQFVQRWVAANLGRMPKWQIAFMAYFGNRPDPRIDLTMTVIHIVREMYKDQNLEIPTSLMRYL